MKNYYDILGLDESATQEDIKKAYRKMSKKYHPDVNPEGEEMFKEVNEAYENIGEENKRLNYDNRRKNPFGGGMDINSIFESMMGHTFNQKQKAPDKVINLDITPVESYYGVKKEINYTFSDQCDGCKGNGGDRRICQHCNGQGVFYKTFGTGMFKQTFQTQCQNCNGQGSIITRTCDTCRGVGILNRKERLNVSIPANVDNGDFMRVQGKGDYNNHLKMRGDTILKINMNPSDGYEKIGLDLVYYKKTTPLQMVLSEDLFIPHPDGDLKISMPEIFDTDKPLRLSKKGYKSNQGVGDFYVKLSVTNDKKIDSDLKRKISELLK
jgi:molecular chaperone DnaJ